MTRVISLKKLKKQKHNNNNLIKFKNKLYWTKSSWSTNLANLQIKLNVNLIILLN